MFHSGELPLLILFWSFLFLSQGLPLYILANLAGYIQRQHQAGDCRRCAACRPNCQRSRRPRPLLPLILTHRRRFVKYFFIYFFYFIYFLFLRPWFVEDISPGCASVLCDFVRWVSHDQKRMIFHPATLWGFALIYSVRLRSKQKKKDSRLVFICFLLAIYKRLVGVIT